MSQFSDYRAAYEAVVHAQQIGGDPAALEATRGRLMAAERPLAARIGAIWDRNVQAVQDAQAAVDEAMRGRVAVEIEVASSARARDPQRPVLNADELARVQEAVITVEEARGGLTVAQAAFKAGVTPDQMESDLGV